MRVLDAKELQQVAGGAPKWQKVPADHRAAPGLDVTPELPGKRTGWCRGYGNMKNVGLGAPPKHDGTICGAS